MSASPIDPFAIEYLAQQLYLDSCEKHGTEIRVGVRWGCMRAELRAKWLKAARQKVREWMDDEARAEAARSERIPAFFVEPKQRKRKDR